MNTRLNLELLGKRFAAFILIFAAAAVTLLSTAVFTRAAYASEPIAWAECTVAAPLANANPDYTGASADPSKYTVTVSQWYRSADYFPNLDPTDVFDADMHYIVQVIFEPEEGYYFDEDTEFTINGEATFSTSSDPEVWVRQSSVMTVWGALIESANCTVKAPLAGAHPDFAPVSDDPDIYTVETFQWYGQVEGYPEVAKDGTFEEGTSYCVRILFKPEPGYYFDDDTVFTINGQMSGCVGLDIGTRLQEIAGQYASSRPLGFYVVTVGALNIRSDPAFSATRVGGLSYGDVVEAVAVRGIWLALDPYAGAWIDGDYLALTYSKETAIYPTEFTVTVGTLSVREDISTNSARIGGFKEGDKILATGVRTDADGEAWLVLDYVADGGYHQLGYVLAKYTDAKDAIIELHAANIDLPDFPDDNNEYTFDPEPIQPSIEWDDEITLLPGLPDFPDNINEFIVDTEFAQLFVVWEGEISNLGERNLPITNGDAVFTMLPGDSTRFSSR